VPETETFEPPKTRPTVASWGGTVLQTYEERQIIVREKGEECVTACARCRMMFFHNKPNTDVCYGCWYVGELDSYEEAYSDVFDALRKAGHEPSIAQTGGMCMTIHVPMKDGYYAWLTDRDDTLSFERRLEDGWTLGVYAGWDEDSDGMPLPVFDGEDYLSVDFKSADFAVGMARIALDKLEEHLS
jgi:hypothetical protein